LNRSWSVEFMRVTPVSHHRDGGDTDSMDQTQLTLPRSGFVQQVCQRGQILATHFVLPLRVSITQTASQKLACYKGVEAVELIVFIKAG